MCKKSLIANILWLKKIYKNKKKNWLKIDESEKSKK